MAPHTIEAGGFKCFAPVVAAIATLHGWCSDTAQCCRPRHAGMTLGAVGRSASFLWIAAVTGVNKIACNRPRRNRSNCCGRRHRTQLMARLAVAHRWRGGRCWLNVTSCTRAVALRCWTVGEFVTVTAQTPCVTCTRTCRSNMHRVIHGAWQFIDRWSHGGHRRFFPRHNGNGANRVADRANFIGARIELALMTATIGARFMIFVHARCLDPTVAFNLMATAAGRHVNATVLMHGM